MTNLSLPMKVIYPLSLLPQSRPLYHRLILQTKSSFSKLCILITHHYGPTKFVLTTPPASSGGLDFSLLDLDVAEGGKKKIDLGPTVFIANHQIMLDWLYGFILADRLFGNEKGVYIILKESLKWIPIVGWVCLLLTSTCPPVRKKADHRWLTRLLRMTATHRGCNFSTSSSFLALGWPTVFLSPDT